MPAPIVRHEPPEDPRDDPSHPIPSLAVIDVTTVKRGGGADLIIVVASPLRADERSLTRLLDKIQGYLGHIRSEDFYAEAGAPTPENTSIVVRLHPESDREVWDLLVRSEAWVQSNNASLVVEALSDYERGAPSN
jgi:hypothetical protein